MMVEFASSMNAPMPFSETGECPTCTQEIGFTTAPVLRQRLACPACHSRLHVVLLSPLELDTLDEIPDSQTRRRHTKKPRQRNQHTEDSDRDEWEGDEEPRNRRQRSNRSRRRGRM